MRRRTLTEEDVEKARVSIPAIGAVKHEIAKVRRRQGGGSVTVPENLVDVLALKLTPRTRQALMARLLDMALDPRGGKLALDAIREIFDRMEGKPRASVISSRDAQDPLLNLYKEVFLGNSKLIPEFPDGEYMVIDE